MGVGTSIRGRFEALEPTRADLLLALAFGLAAALPVTLSAHSRQVPAALAIIAGQTVGLAFRRRYPLPAWCLGFSPFVPVTLVATSVNDAMVATFVGVIFASYSLGAKAGAGHGLIGMRERVRAFGGDLSTGPRDGGGFAVRARIPLHADHQEAA